MLKKLSIIEKIYLCIKGKSDAQNALKVLNCTLEKIEEYDLRDNLGSRSLVVINKNKSTNDKYPRKYAEIKRKPL